MSNRQPEEKQIGSTPSRRGRPELSEMQRAEMQRKIAEVTLNLFRDQGYRQVSMRRIAKQIGCAPMTLYKYYNSKIAILHTLWEDVFSDLFSELDSDALISLTPIERLTTSSLNYLQFWLNNEDHYRLVFMTEGVNQPEVSLFVDNPSISEKYQVFADLIRKASSKELSEDEAQKRASVLVCFLNGIAHNLITISGYPWPTPEYLVDRACLAALN